MWRTHSCIMPQTLPNMGNAAEVVGQTPWSARDASSRRTCTNGGAVALDRGRRPRGPARASQDADPVAPVRSRFHGAQPWPLLLLRVFSAILLPWRETLSARLAAVLVNYTGS